LVEVLWIFGSADVKTVLAQSQARTALWSGDFAKGSDKLIVLIISLNGLAFRNFLRESSHYLTEPGRSGLADLWNGATLLHSLSVKGPKDAGPAPS
jgi:hypothetical protein